MSRECIAVRVRLINRVITALYDDALRPFDIRISQVNILSAVGHLGECPPRRAVANSVYREVDLEPGRRAHETARLAESDPPTGGRNQTIRLTPAGTKLLGKIQPSWENAQADGKSS